MRKVIGTPRAPGAIGPYSQGIVAGGLLFTSGQLPIDPQTGIMEEGDARRAAALCLNNIQAILEEQGLTMADIAKTTVYLTDLGDFAAVNEAYAAFFNDAPPARSCVQVAALPKGAAVEIEAIAALR